MRKTTLLLILIILFGILYLSKPTVEKYMSYYKPPKYFYCITNNKCLRLPQKNFPLQQNICPGFNIRGKFNPLIFYSEKSCNAYKNRCSNLTTKDSCKQKTWCGWCTDKDGKGKCVLGTPTGPMDMMTNMCYPDAPHGKNAFYYGHLPYRRTPDKLDPNYVEAAFDEEHVYPNKLI